jgi:exosortase
MTLVAVLVLVAAAFVPLLWAHCRLLWVRPHYQFFPMVFVGAAILALSGPRKSFSLQPDKTWKSWVLMGCSWCLLAGAELFNSSWLSAVASLILLVAVIYAAGGRSLLGQLFPAWLFLWLIIPLPFGLDQSLVLALQRLATQWSSAVLDLMKVYHVVSGNVVEIGSKRFFVAEACTGINSLFSILACTVFYVIYLRTSVVRSILLIIAAMAWVLVANVARIVLVVWFAKQGWADMSGGLRHDLLGFVLFAVALALIWSSDRLLMIGAYRKKANVLPGSRLPETTPEEPNGAMESQLAGTWLNSYKVGVAFGLLLAWHVLLHYAPNAPSTLAAVDGGPDPQRLNLGSLPEQIDGWKRDKFADEHRNPGSAYGEYSRIWTFNGDAQSATFAVDYPFSEWHLFMDCYTNQGWRVEDKAGHRSSEEGTPGYYSIATLKKTGRKTAYLFNCQFDQAGRVAEPPRIGLRATLARHQTAFRRLLALGGQTAGTEQLQVGTLLQFQMLVETDAPFSAAELSRARERFFLAYRSIHDRLF